MKIAVIDRSKESGRQLAEEMNRLLPNTGIQTEVWNGHSIFENDFTGADVIFLAVNRMYEVEVGNKLMRLCPDTPMVVVSDNADYSVEAFNLNARHYLTPPLTSDSILRALERCGAYIRSLDGI